MKILLWALESDYDAETVKIITHKIFQNHNLNIDIHAEGKPKRGIVKQGAKGLVNAVKNYLKDSECVIFVIDRDGTKATAERRAQPNSLINQVEQVLSHAEFCGKMHLVLAVNEIEVWLLVDCVGIFYFFTQNHYSLPKECKGKNLDEHQCREIIQIKYKKFINKYSSNNTEVIEEPESGSRKGAKEYLEKFTGEIYKLLHEGDKKVHTDWKYAERTSPDIAKHLKIDTLTMSKNASLKTFSDNLLGCVSQT